MKASVLSIGNEKVGSIELPEQFHEDVRPDLIKRAVLAVQSHKRQIYGAKPGAGQRSSATLSKRRRDYKGSYGIGISRTPRKVLTRSGTRFNWVGAFVPGTVGGRRAHPPKIEKIWWLKLNKKERRKAIRSAISSTVIKDIVSQRGHITPPNYPLIVEGKIEDLAKTKDAISFFNSIGLGDELARVSVKSIRAGKGKHRGRKYKKKVGPLVVLSKECSAMKAISNIPGFDSVEVKSLNAELLAPGASIGRLTVWSQKAIEIMAKEKLFM